MNHKHNPTANPSGSKTTMHPVESCQFHYTSDTINAAADLDNGSYTTIEQNAHNLGMKNGEPITVMLDCLLKYAIIYRARSAGPLKEDGVLGVHWLAAAKAVRGLLNGDGVFAMKRNITTDSKSNGACESMFWSAIKAAGFSESDL